jgi:hypothetical protein
MDGETINGQRDPEGAAVTADRIYLEGLWKNIQNIWIVSLTVEDDDNTKKQCCSNVWHKDMLRGGGAAEAELHSFSASEPVRAGSKLNAIVTIIGDFRHNLSYIYRFSSQCKVNSPHVADCQSVLF